MNFNQFKSLIISQQAQRPRAIRPFLEEFCRENGTSKSELCRLAGLDKVSERELAKKIWGGNTGRFLAYPNFQAAAKDIKSKHPQRPKNLQTFFKTQLKGLIGIAEDALKSLPGIPDDTRHSNLANMIWGESELQFEDLKSKIINATPSRPSGPSTYFTNMFSELGISRTDLEKSLGRKVSTEQLADLIWGEKQEISLENVLATIRKNHAQRPKQLEDFFNERLLALTGIGRTAFQSLAKLPDCNASTLGDYIWGKEKELTLEEIISKIKEIQPQKPERVSEFFHGIGQRIGVGFTKIKQVVGDRRLTPAKFADQVWSEEEKDFEYYKKQILQDQPERPEVCDYFFGKSFTEQYGVGAATLLKLAGEKSKSRNKLGDLIWGEKAESWEETKKTILADQPDRPSDLRAYFKSTSKRFSLGKDKLKALAGIPKTDKGLNGLADAIWGTEKKYQSFSEAKESILRLQAQRPKNISTFFRSLSSKIGVTVFDLKQLEGCPDFEKESELAKIIWSEEKDLSFEEIKAKILEHQPETPEKPSIFFRNLYKEIGISLNQIQKALGIGKKNTAYLVSKIWESETYYETFEEAKLAILKAQAERPSNIKEFFENDIQEVIGITGYRLRGDLLNDHTITWTSLADQIWGESPELSWDGCKEEILKARPIRPDFPSIFFRDEMYEACGFGKTALLNRCPDTSVFTDLELANLIWGEDDNAPGVYLDKLDISDAVSMFGDDPLRLKQFIKLYYPDMDDSDIDRVVISSLEGLRPSFNNPIELHSEFAQGYNAPYFQTNLNDTESTDEHSFVLSGRSDSPYVQVTGAYTRKIIVRKDGTFSANIPLPKTGETNLFNIYGFDPNRKIKSAEQTLSIQQTSSVSDTEEAFLNLIETKGNIIESLKSDSHKQNFFIKSIELSLLRYFSKSEADGFKYLQERIDKASSDSMKAILKGILTKFQSISKKDYSLKDGTKLYFFQKYCIYEILKAKQEGRPGIILANEQGLGKTVTALALINGSPAVIISPNPVVSSWMEQEAKFIPEPRLTSLEGSYNDRDKQLETTDKPQVVVNVEYMRGMNIPRSKALSNKADTLIIDEADYLGSKGSQQSLGTSMIDPKFSVLLTATPFKNPSQITNLLKFLYPDDEGFGSRQAFARAFSLGSNADLNFLNVLLNENTIRIRKRDVFEEYDPSLPLSQQSDKLPKKKIIEPSSTENGQFYLTDNQCLSILELFDDYQSWCEKHKSHGQITDEDKSYERFREGFFQKKEALRQIMNDPAYVGFDEASPKHEAMANMVRPRIEDGKKGVIFCRYKGQVKAYADKFKDLGVATYYGDLESNSNGYKVNSDGEVIYYQVDEYERPVLKNGDFVETDKEHGKPIKAFDYERIKFQNDPNTKVMIATYDAGSVGVTFTAADFVIFDDLAQTYRDEYQAMDRAHRIDNDRKKYEVEYLWLQAQYPESFLSRLKDEIKEKYFDCGTYDEIHRLNLQNQSRIFHRILDGIGSDDELDRISNLRDRMPFLFDNNN